MNFISNIAYEILFTNVLYFYKTFTQHYFRIAYKLQQHNVNIKLSGGMTADPCKLYK